jgi:hypothetical protein
MAYVAYSPGGGVMTMAVRVAGTPTDLLPAVRHVVAGFSPDIALIQPTTVEAQFQESYSDEHLFARIASLFGFAAAPVAVVNRTFLQRYVSGRNLLGHIPGLPVGRHRHLRNACVQGLISLRNLTTQYSSPRSLRSRSVQRRNEVSITGRATESSRPAD